MALFCVGAQSAIVAVLRLGLSAVAPRAAQHTVLLPWRGGRHVAAPTCVLVFAPLSVGLAVLWGLHRGAPWAWAYQVPSPTPPAGYTQCSAELETPACSMADCLPVHAEPGSLPPFVQDMMGICLVLSCLRGIRVNSLKVGWQPWHWPLTNVQATRPPALDGVAQACQQTLLSCQCLWQVATILLGSMLCYDVFWVFIQPRLSHSSSVMVEVCRWPWPWSARDHCSAHQCLQHERLATRRACHPATFLYRWRQEVRRSSPSQLCC